MPTGSGDTTWLVVSLLGGPGCLLLGLWGLWNGLKVRPGSTDYEIETSALIIHASRTMRRLDPPNVLPWTDIAVILMQDGSYGARDLWVQARDGTWYALMPRFIEPNRERAVE